MEYSIQKLALLAGISTRTLRYYDEINLLKPARISSSGYRIYGEKQVDALQQILFFRQSGMALEKIKAIIKDDGFDRQAALLQQREELLSKKRQIDLMLSNIDKTLAAQKGLCTMNDKEKFEGLKKSLIDENEKKYGAEIRERYGNEAVEKSNKKLAAMSRGEYDAAEKLSNEILETLSEAMATGDINGEVARRLAAMHKEWIQMCWSSYSKEAHAGLAQMYVADERFAKYYNDVQPGGAVFLRDAIISYLGE